MCIRDRLRSWPRIRAAAGAVGRALHLSPLDKSHARASGGVGAVVARGVPFTACLPVAQDFGEAFRAGRLARCALGLPDGTSAL
eukprot:7757946-Alexandrium_andersonii.AAC.1